MNILHYSLGIYPDRQGGLVRYSTDLATEQAKENSVYYLIPGKLGIIDKRVRIVKGQDEKGLKVFKINNAHPIPLYAGIRNIELYTHSAPMIVYINFFKTKSINVIYIHSLMGLHLEFLQAAKYLKIPIVMIVHDFFGICPVTTLLKNGHVCNENSICKECYDCSLHAHGYIKLAVGQSNIYKSLKRKNLIGSVRNVALKTQKSGSQSGLVQDKSVSEQYKKLGNYYFECFSLVNWFLFNSTQTQEVFERRLGKLPGDVLHLLHCQIQDKRMKRTFLNDSLLHVGFMGESTEFKGYEILRSSILKLNEEGYSIELDVYNDSVQEEEHIVRKGKYTSNDLENIYNSLDVIAIPSICYETLSFAAIEAISHGMPCILSNRVGAKDLVIDGETGFIVRAGDISELNCVLKALVNTPNILGKINDNIMKQEYVFSFRDHCEILMNSTKKLISTF